jgi:hypothetical protein
MSITVYWACLEDQWMLAKEPESVASVFYKKGMYDKNNPGTCLNYCPVFNSNLQNLFTLRSLYEYEFTAGEDSVSTPYYDETFYRNHVDVRDFKLKFFSFKNRYIFFAEESLDVTFYEFPSLEDNNITQRCMPIPGKFNIGKWFRNTEFAFYLRKGYDTFKIDRDEIYSYIRFHTDEKIVFKQFRWSDKMKEYNNDGFKLNFHGYVKSIENYYKAFKNKKLILKEIKDNLL